jgi:hypothetical protein
MSRDCPDKEFAPCNNCGEPGELTAIISAILRY